MQRRSVQVEGGSYSATSPTESCGCPEVFMRRSFHLVNLLTRFPIPVSLS